MHLSVPLHSGLLLIMFMCSTQALPEVFHSFFRHAIHSHAQQRRTCVIFPDTSHARPTVSANQPDLWSIGALHLTANTLQVWLPVAAATLCSSIHSQDPCSNTSHSSSSSNLPSWLLLQHPSHLLAPLSSLLHLPPFWREPILAGTQEAGESAMSASTCRSG